MSKKKMNSRSLESVAQELKEKRKSWTTSVVTSSISSRLQCIQQEATVISSCEEKRKERSDVVQEDLSAESYSATSSWRLQNDIVCIS
ncbi:hypothetical protein F511_25777 [Dorcoceras hygrometricum]|uniref:Uncharacterized protein n=1 Tax=Dorcoceras hygrometricum TaxID=472368 RepID=A0A2Z7C1C6_9LAMI|nr:hypothetical protein F511_25777 [Dorcoceras hygrometricum]